MKTRITPILLSVSLTTLLAVAFTTQAHAQDNVITYQGQLTDNGLPASGIYDLRFTIYDLDTGGTEVGGPITNTSVALSNGAFTATLDFGPGVFDGSPRWLEIGVATNGSEPFEALAPRQLITSVPYAIQAANAANAVAAASVTGSVSAGQLTGTIAPANIAPGTITSTMMATGSVTSAQLAAGAVTTTALANGAVTADKVATTTDNYLTQSITNPTPEANDYFGHSMAAVGADRILIGAYSDDTGADNAGAAYLFSTDGTLLTTLTNPTPALGDGFGISVAAVGTDRVLIGASLDDTGADNAGAAYLFGTDGTLLTTFTNPTPAADDNFGYSVVAVGTDRVLIGAYLDDTGTTNAGAAYLFSTDGTLLTTFTNPTPTAGDRFGNSVAAVGTDRVLIGAYFDDTGALYAGAAYLFSTNGTLLTTFTNPTPAVADVFGCSVAAVGANQVLIGAYQENAGEPDAGAAYLFSTDGTLLTTFTNPAPAAGDNFGFSVAAVGTGRVLIGAHFDDTGATNAGAAYLFSTDGTLLTTFTNPTPAVADLFGGSVAAVGADQVLIGASSDDTGATDAGAAYLFSLKSYVPGLIAEGVRDGAITTLQLADGAVDSSKLAAGSVGTAQLAAGAITTVNIASNSITAGQLAAGAVTTEALADGAVTADKILTTSEWGFSRSISISNPVPENGDRFGTAVAGVGGRMALIGAYHDNTNTGVAYLFSSNGTLLTTFTNPTPDINDLFGAAVVGVGRDTVLIGAYGDDTGAPSAGAAYLFSTNGTLLTTFTNPTPGNKEAFGMLVASLDTDTVLIGALVDNTGASRAGTAYLFSTNGTLLTTITNPTPESGHYFDSVAAVGSDQVLLGARFDGTDANDAGAAYLFSTNGALLTTFTNPTPESYDQFGAAVAVVNEDTVLISAPYDDTGANDAGAAYLFSTDGTLLTTFTNPTPESGDYFGYSVAAVGSDQVLISAPFDDTGTNDAGATYLFSTDGTLLATLLAPTPESSDQFGSAVAAMGAHTVLIGAPNNNTGASLAGAAYLFASKSYVPGLVAEGVRDGGITTESLADGAVGTTQLAEGAVGTTQLAEGAVTTVNIASNSITTGHLAAGAVTAAKIATASDWLLSRSIVNPSPESNGYFGRAVAALGAHTVLIGAGDSSGDTYDVGAAYLFSTDGVLLATFANPTPESADKFGLSLSGVGADKVLIGAHGDNTGGKNTGAAYLFSTNGTLLTTYNNPTPEAYDSFGYAVAGVATDTVLIGAAYDDIGASNAGAAYLFSTDGTLLTTFTNPTPETGDGFAYAVAGVNEVTVLIGAPGDYDYTGAAYLFSTDGTLLTTFTNPTPEMGDGFGVSVAAVGTNRVLISATGDNAGADLAGAAYLFSTDGTLLTTFTNPTPETHDFFGYAVAGVGSDKVLIGAYGDNTGAASAGAAYLFSTDGILLATFTNPTPEMGDRFGYAAAAVGTSTVLIGAYLDKTAGNHAGAAYLFSARSYVPGLVAEGVRNGAVTTESLADGAVDSTKLADGAITTDKIADGAVGATQLGQGAAAENLAASGQSAVPSGGMILSSNYSDGNLFNAGYVKLGKVDLGDVWEQRAGGPQPGGRSGHTAVWTGSEMIVWGGRYYDGGYQYLGDGGRYDPVANTWSAVSTTAAPAAREQHTAVWTGSEMIVWGGHNYSLLNTGGRYDPVANSWTAVTNTAAPAAREQHTAVWTGSEMIVWGGSFAIGGYLNDGGRYNPTGNSWTALSTSSAPSARSHHTAVWTGSEMIVWGGQGDVGILDDGGCYNPTGNNWTALSTSSAPSARDEHTAVWTGSEMIVWGGQGIGGERNDGGRYNPNGNNWTGLNTSTAPSARAFHTAVWTGSEMIVWGGYYHDGSSHSLNDGGRYNPTGNNWTALSTSGAPSARDEHTAVWTGSEMIVWGGQGIGGSYLNDTFSYVPSRVLYLYQRP